jgi:peptide/nickel transport system substrate-binding protein
MNAVLRLTGWLALVAALLIPLPAASQEGRGVIVEVNPVGAANIGPLNPLRCWDTACRRITDLLFPTLIGVDPATGTFTQTGDDSALALDWEVSDDGTVYTFHLRDDVTWSDGLPVTAYDVFYSYLAAMSESVDSAYRERVTRWIRGAAPLDAHTIAFVMAEPTCSGLDYANLPVIPAHAFAPDFAAAAASAFQAGDDPLAQFEGWQAAQPDNLFAALVNQIKPTATAGRFEIDRIQPLDYVRLVTPDRALGFAYVDLPGYRTAVDLFLSGETNLLENPPYSRRADLRAAPDVQVFEYPGPTWTYISFNLADPQHPFSAFDDSGAPQDQGHHPIFGDVRVRRAVQMGLDVHTLIDTALQGSGVVMAADQLPASWAFDPALAPVAYDPVGAADLLESAGWKDVSGDGIRECIGCLYAKEGQPLTFDLLYSDINRVPVGPVVTLIVQQLRRVGFGVSVYQLSPGEVLVQAQNQRYDAYLAGWTESVPINPAAHAALFARAENVLQKGFNTGSYFNPDLDALFAQADTLPGCDLDARAAIYRQVQGILQADQPYAWLFAPTDLIAVRREIAGIVPAPFWTITR